MKAHPVITQVVEVARRKGMTNRDLALAADLTPSGLSRLLNGHHLAQSDTLDRLAKAVGMRIGLLPDDDFAADVLSGRILEEHGDR